MSHRPSLAVVPAWLKRTAQFWGRDGDAWRDAPSRPAASELPATGIHGSHYPAAVHQPPSEDLNMLMERNACRRVEQ